MSTPVKTKNLADLYGLRPLEWEAVAASLTDVGDQAPGGQGPDRHSHWLTTINPDGSPHTTGVGGFWEGGGFYIVSGRGARKGRNMEREPRCTVAVATDDYDVVVEGLAALVTDPATVAHIAKVAAEGGWPAKPDESGRALTAPYSAPSAGPAPWHVYRVTPTKANALYVRDPGGATSWSFG